MKILVIDDNKDISSMYNQFLTLKGHQCVETNQGQNSVALIQKHEFDIVILDLAMPEFDGFDVVDMLVTEKLLDEHLRVIVITASSISDEKMTKLKRQGVYACLKKPINLQELLVWIGQK